MNTHPIPPTKPKPAAAKEEPLSESEEKWFRELDAIVKNQGGKASLEAAKALFTMEQNNLFRGHANSLKAYASSIEISPSYATRLVQTGKVYYKLEPLWKGNSLSAPTSAWQLRPLCKIKDDAILRATWDEAVKLSDGKSPAAAVVEGCVTKLPAPPKPDRPKSTILRLDLKAVPGLLEELTKQAEIEKLSLEQSALKLFAAFVEVKSHCFD